MIAITPDQQFLAATNWKPIVYGLLKQFAHNFM